MRTGKSGPNNNRQARVFPDIGVLADILHAAWVHGHVGHVAIRDNLRRYIILGSMLRSMSITPGGILGG